MSLMKGQINPDHRGDYGIVIFVHESRYYYRMLGPSNPLHEVIGDLERRKATILAAYDGITSDIAYGVARKIKPTLKPKLSKLEKMLKL